MSEYTISKDIYKKIKAHAEKDAPIEACGYLGSKEKSITNIFEMQNVDKSPVHFSFDPKEQFNVVKEARKLDIKLIAVYHSHPETPARLSGEDIRLANDTDIIYIIYSCLEDNLKAFKVNEEKEIKEISLEVI